MNICMVTAEFPPNCGGIGNYVYNLSKKLVENGHNITVFTRGTWNCGSFIEKIDGISVKKVRFAPIYPFHVRLHGFFLNKEIMNLENNFDIIHSHSPLVPIIRTKLPTVLTEHGTVKGGLDNSQPIDIHSIITKLFSREFISWDLKTLNNSNHITVVSQSCKEELINRYYIKKEIIVVNNGVDTTYFSPREIKDIIEPYILYTGRLDSRKGLVDFVESAKFISQEYPNMKFILTGFGPLKKYLEQKIDTLGLRRNFYFAGFVDRQRLLEYYQNATIYILPSYYEGLPTTLLEAMSCGIPSIATNVDGSSEVIVNYKNGILVPPKNPKELAKSVLMLLNNKSLRQELGINARNYVIETYDWNKIAHKFEEIYCSIIRG